MEGPNAQPKGLRLNLPIPRPEPITAKTDRRTVPLIRKGRAVRPQVALQGIGLPLTAALPRATGLLPTVAAKAPGIGPPPQTGVPANQRAQAETDPQKPATEGTVRIPRQALQETAGNGQPETGIQKQDATGTGNQQTETGMVQGIG